MMSYIFSPTSLCLAPETTVGAVARLKNGNRSKPPEELYGRIFAATSRAAGGSRR
jgi:hypothetical protein